MSHFILMCEWSLREFKLYAKWSSVHFASATSPRDTRSGVLKAGSEGESAGDAPLWHQRQRGAMKAASERGEGCSTSFIVRPEPWVHFYSDPWLLCVQVYYYCSSNSLFSLQCLHLQYVQTLLCLGRVDSWTDHQSKSPSSSALENVGMTSAHPKSCPGAAPAPPVGLEPQRKEEHNTDLCCLLTS